MKAIFWQFPTNFFWNFPLQVIIKSAHNTVIANWNFNHLSFLLLCLIIYMCMESRIYLCINGISRKWNDALLFFLQTQHLVISLESYGYFNLAEETISGFSQHTLQSFTVERLRALLRQSGLSTKGKKVRETMLNLLILNELAEFLFEIRMASA